MTLDQLDQIIALAREVRQHIGLYIAGGKCRSCGINMIPPKGVDTWSCEHLPTCQTQIAAKTESWALQLRAQLSS